MKNIAHSKSTQYMYWDKTLKFHQLSFLHSIFPFKPFQRTWRCNILFFFSAITFFMSFPISPHSYQVVDAVVDALTSQSPRDRYLVGFDAKCFFVWMARLPTAVADSILRMVLKLSAPQGCKWCGTGRWSFSSFPTESPSTRDWI